MSSEENIVGVRFQRAGKVYYFDPNGIDLEVNEHVVVEVEHGLKIGRVVIAPRQIISSEITEPLKPVLRKASPEDHEQKEKGRQKEKETIVKCRELADKFNLPIKVLDADSDLDISYITIFFSAEGRVDFRQMVRELASVAKVRVELRQVGPRDEAKFIGGVGRCGYPLCCITFLTEFNPLSIKIAKEQNLSLNPAKISGNCGRLLCCLGYESEFYRQMKEKLPPIGHRVLTSMGEANVIGVNQLKETVTVQLESLATVEFPVAEVSLANKRQDKGRRGKREPKSNPPG
ncbi:stage 0 sporulation family protein [Chloroflexota bacterium]